MIARLVLLALAATACSPGGGNTATAPANAVEAAVIDAPPAIAPPVAASAVPPKPGELKTFRDWTVGCDNGLTCAMASLGPETGDFPEITVGIARDAGPRGRFTVTIDGHEDADIRVAVDGKPLTGGAAMPDALVARIANGSALNISDAKGKPLARISLAGASAALRYIDAAQGRAGTVTAVVAKGAKGADTVPSAPPLPVIAAVTPGGKAAAPTPAQIAEMRKIAGCDTDGFAGDTTPESHALGGGATLVFVPCSAGAYNLSSALFVLRDAKLSPAVADVPTGFTEGGATVTPAQVVNGAFERGLVTSYAKGRGLGDCGVSQTLAWDGAKLRLVEQGEMGDCRGNTDLITTWRATVVRK